MVFQYVCDYLSTVTLKRADDPCAGTTEMNDEQQQRSKLGQIPHPNINSLSADSLHNRLHINSSSLCSLNRGIKEDQMDISQQKITYIAGCQTSASCLFFYIFHPHCSFFSIRSWKTAQKLFSKIPMNRYSSYLINLEVKFRKQKC